MKDSDITLVEAGVAPAPAAAAAVVGDGPAAAGADPDEGPGVAGAPLAAVEEVPGPGAVGDMSVISSSNRFRLMARELVEIWTMLINQGTLFDRREIFTSSSCSCRPQPRNRIQQTALAARTRPKPR